MVEWLEDFLRRSSMTLLMVTHDRYFLDRVCNQIMELDAESLYQYDGNYAYYLGKRQERMDAKAVEIERANNLYRTELDWMRRMPQARGHKARYREEAFYELEKVAKQRIYDNKVQLNVKSSYIGNKIFEANHLSKSFGDMKILDDFSYIFSRYEKMGIVGNNGTGKSSFLKILMGQLPLDGGSLEIGSTVRFGYYSQEGMQFDEQMKVIDAVRDIAEVVDLGNGKRLGVSQFLQYFLFSPETQHNFIYKLSGGERRRLYLCTVLMRNPNFLVLDEPTNDLDIMTLQVLEEYLKGFGGCVIVVSHDRYFMDKVVDHILVFNGQGDIRDFPGNYTQYRAWKEEKERHDREQVKAAQPVASKSERPRQNDKRRMSFKERREFEQLGLEIEALEAEKKQLEADLCSGTLSVDALTEKSKRLPLLGAELDEKSFRWLELSEIESGGSHV
jgi:ATP-binding cassette subfamily F protein uup